MFNPTFRSSLGRLWETAVAPSPFINEPYARHRIRFLNNITVLYIGLALLILTLQLVLFPIASLIHMTSFTAVLMGLGVSLIFYLLNHTPYYHAVNYIAILTTYVTIDINAAASDAPHLQIAYVIIIPLIGTLLLSVNENIFASLFSVVELVVIAKLMGDIPDKMLTDLVILCVLTNVIIIFVSYQRDRLEADRRQALIELEKARVSAQFIRDVSHEFRTPLSIISTGVYLLEKTLKPDDRHARADQIQSQISYITQLIDDSLTITQLDNQTGSDFHDFSIDTLVQNTIYALKPEAIAKGLTLELTSQPAIPTVQGNEVDLQIAINHLLKNAITYTQQGGIQVRLLCQQSTVHIEIQDTGIGISEVDLNRIFDPFYRVDQARTRRSAGLGLTIVKKIVERHHGSIRVESVPGKGTTFIMTVPC